MLVSLATSFGHPSFPVAKGNRAALADLHWSQLLFAPSRVPRRPQPTCFKVDPPFLSPIVLYRNNPRSQGFANCLKRRIPAKNGASIARTRVLGPNMELAFEEKQYWSMFIPKLPISVNQLVVQPMFINPTLQLAEGTLLPSLGSYSSLASLGSTNQKAALTIFISHVFECGTPQLLFG